MSKRRAVQVGRSSTEYLDVVSYGHRGPAVPGEFSVAEIEKIRLTVHRAPEVMVKVSGGGRDAGAVAAHFAYLGRSGKLEIETDDGRLLTGSGAAREIVEDWNLDAMPATRREARTGRPAPKQVHNIVLSMPRKTDPQKLLAAARAFAEGEFAERHRYAMVLHTDQQHPHVHLVVKAVAVDGERLYVRKQTLREWREHFAEELRARGIAANATHRAVRGAMRTHKNDGIRRAIARGGWAGRRRPNSSSDRAKRNSARRSSIFPAGCPRLVPRKRPWRPRCCIVSVRRVLNAGSGRRTRPRGVASPAKTKAPQSSPSCVTGTCKSIASGFELRSLDRAFTRELRGLCSRN
jgi:hypothetical protein